jgi:SAM-dependent methyltransferase
MNFLKSSVEKLLRPVKNAMRFVYFSPAKQVLVGIPVIRNLYSPWDRRHPFDRKYGIDTSGFLPVDKIHPDPAVQSLIIAYAASQASIIRRALAALEDVRDYTFVDLGCGKGRATVIASEFPYREIVGVELSPDLAKIAVRNAAKITKKFRDRPPITIHTLNATDFQPPTGKLVIYIYHPFGQQIMGQLVRKLEDSIASGHTTHAFVVSCNPVYCEEFDDSLAFRRWFANTIPYESAEVGYGPDQSDTVVIWQSSQGSRRSPHENADRKIVILYPGYRAGLAV